MKKMFILIALVLSIVACSNVHAQQVAPPGAGDKDLADKNIKTRSIELERIDREARKANNQGTNKPEAKAEDRLAAKYEEIKTDFEQIQMSQDAVIKAYQSKGKIDYEAISKSALEINKSSTRLHSNLFPATDESSALKSETKRTEKRDEKIKEENKRTLSVRDLIVGLDNTIGSFAASPMFQNLRAIDAAVSAKAKLDLEKIISLSASLDAEARKMNTNEK